MPFQERRNIAARQFRLLRLFIHMYRELMNVTGEAVHLLPLFGYGADKLILYTGQGFLEWRNQISSPN
jgi:hypothetical protein